MFVYCELVPSVNPTRFDAADNDKDFSDTVKKVKGESKGES